MRQELMDVFVSTESPSEDSGQLDSGQSQIARWILNQADLTKQTYFPGAFLIEMREQTNTQSSSQVGSDQTISRGSQKSHLGRAGLVKPSSVQRENSPSKPFQVMGNLPALFWPLKTRPI